MSEEKSSVIFVHTALHWALYHLWFQNKVESYVNSYISNLVQVNLVYN